MAGKRHTVRVLRALRYHGLRARAQDILKLQQSNEAKEQEINTEKELCLVLTKKKDDEKLQRVRD